MRYLAVGLILIIALIYYPLNAQSPKPRTPRIIQRDTLPIPAPKLVFPPDNTEEIHPYSLLLKWNKTPRTGRYEIQLSLSPRFETTLSQNDSTPRKWYDTCVIFNDLPPYSTVYWRVRSSNRDTTSLWSETFSFNTIGRSTAAQDFPADNAIIQCDTIHSITHTIQPKRIINLFQINYDGTPSAAVTEEPAQDTIIHYVDIRTGWSKVGGTNIKLYTSEVSTDSTFKHIDAYITGGLFFNATHALYAESKTYYWRVKAICNSGMGEWSRVRKFTVVIAKSAVNIDSPNDSKRIE